MTDFLRFFPVTHPDANGPEVHLMKAPDALPMLNGNGEVPFTSVAFRKEALESLLAQDKAWGLKFFIGNNGHHMTLVAFAVDADGVLMADANHIAIENGERCPPFC